MKKPIYALIHTALVAEAKPIVGYFALKCAAKIPYNIYEDDKTALIASGIGAQNTKKALEYALCLYEPRKIINIGIAGCGDENIKIGSLFCATHKSLPIPYATLSSHDKPVTDRAKLRTLLADQEAEAFLSVNGQNVEKFVFKVVSDHLSGESLTKGEVSALIQTHLKTLEKYVREI